jgi:hypothetical protein
MKRFYALSISVSIAGLLLFSACRNQQDKKVLSGDATKEFKGLNAGTGNFGIEAPTGWMKKDTTMNGVKITFLLSPDASNGFRANMNVVTEAMQGLSMDQYMEKNMKIIGQYMQNFALLGQGDTTISGHAAKWIHYTQTASGRDVEQVGYFIPIRDISYGITCSAVKGEFDKTKSQFDQALGTFNVH